ncbi:MAG: hypothetical protein F4073_07535 [Rhodobacteraceae bacterium]|nr:hypothetical protein [Paracoccaceae bacterium]MYF45198.1 hypothetical protein [Paracoccaceae bacterium]MYI91790.1 hypothetical protein [Paracoccaceae bacterium]
MRFVKAITTLDELSRRNRLFFTHNDLRMRFPVESDGTFKGGFARLTATVMLSIQYRDRETQSPIVPFVGCFE